jgi:hypothetical protein
VPSPKAPDAVKLLYRYEESEPWQERLLFQESSGDWTTSLSALEVRNGFWYKITGGDDQTDEYHVGVRAAPAIMDFLATYHFRPYAARVDEVHRERELKALRGTEVLLRVRTNRALRDGRLEFEANGRAEGVKPPIASVRGEVDLNDPHTFLVRLVLDENGSYRLSFTSTDNEVFRDATSYPVTAIPDDPPTVELTKPGMDIRLPADALLHLEGKARDDIGVQGLVLRMRVVGGDKLRGQPYRSEEELRLADGGYPRELEYKHFVELSRVKSENGQPYALRAGLELEYWLEASDACDYPRANVSESKHYRVLLTEPEKNPEKQKQEKQQSEKDKKQHEQKQDQKLQKENQDRQQQRQEQQAHNKEEQNKGQNGSEGNKSEENKGQNGSEGSQSANGENKGDNKQPGDKQQGDNKAGQGEQKSAEQKDGGQSEQEQKLEERIKQALEKKQTGKHGEGDSKPDKGDTGEGKGSQSNKPDGGDKSQEGNKESDQEGKKDSGENKDKGQPQAGRDPSQGDGKGDNAPRPKPGEKSEPKNGPSEKQEGKAGADKGKPQSATQPGGDKSTGDAQANKGADQDKPKPNGQNQHPTKGENKQADKNGEPKGKREPEGKAKENGSQTKGAGERKDDGNAEKKQGKSAPKGNRSDRAESKQSDRTGEKEKPEKNDGQPNADARQRNATTKEVQDLARKLGSKDAREREQAKQQLQRIEKEAADPQARDKAGEALKKMSEPVGSPDKGTPKKDRGSSGKPKEPGKEGDKNDGSQGTDSSGDKDGDKDKGESSGQKNGQGDKNGKGAESSNPSEGSERSPGGNTPGGGSSRSGGGRSDTQEKDQLRKPEKPRDHRAAQLQLEDFAKRVNKDILKEAGVSEEAWKKYLESKRKQLAPREQPRPEGQSLPQQANQLPSMGGRTIQPNASGQENDSTSNRGQPPPGYRDSFRKFTRQMSDER